MNLLWASVFNLKRLYILQYSIGHPCIKLLLFEFATSFHFRFGASRYITRLNRTSEYKVIQVWNCLELLFSISNVLIYLGSQPDIRVKSYCPLNLLWASVFNLEHLEILRESIGHPNIKLLLFEIAQSFCCQFWESWYITGLNRTSE